MSYAELFSNLLDGPNQALSVRSLRQEGIHARLCRLPSCFLVIMDGDHHHAYLWMLGLDAFRGLQTVDPGHGQVHEHHIWMALIDLLDGFEAIAGFANDPEASCQLEDGAQTFPYVLQIIND
jgi:hypothetical protein